MASFKPDLPQLKELYDQWGGDLFALCFLQAGRPVYALDLVVSALCDMASNPKLHAMALSGREGFLRAGYLTCRDASYRRPKRHKKGKTSPQEGPRPKLPFTMSDQLRHIVKLRLPYSAALFCRERLDLDPAAAGKLMGCSPMRQQRLHDAALKKAEVTQGQARAALEPLGPGEGELSRAWEEFQRQQSQPGFGARQQYRRIRRALDTAVPYLALGVVVLCAVAYLGVEYGWFGNAYAPTQTVEGVVVQGGYDGDALMQSTPETGDVTVYVPEEGGFVAYTVHDTPQSLPEVMRQMVLLGGAPEGVTLLYAQQEGTALDLELSEQAATLTGEAGEQLLQAMTATFAAYTPGLETLSIRCGGEELTVNGKTAQDFLGEEPTVTRTAQTDYRS